MNGIIGLETSLPLSLKLVEEGVLTLDQLIEKMSCNPSDILGLQRGTLRSGTVADITVIDPAARWTVVADTLASKSKNSPFLGWDVQGAAACTVLAGRVVYKR
jgi:dihydroorotase